MARKVLPVLRCLQAKAERNNHREKLPAPFSEAEEELVWAEVLEMRKAAILNSFYQGQMQVLPEDFFSP